MVEIVYNVRVVLKYIHPCEQQGVFEGLFRSIRIFIVLVIAFSLVGLSNSSEIGFVRANTPPLQAWVPAGASTDIEVFHTYIDQNTEFAGLGAHEIDLDEAPLSPSQVSTLTPDANFYVSSPPVSPSAFEIEFNLANNFWGCNMNFGNSDCGREIRQGIAHLIDKNIFTSKQTDISGLSIPLDNPVLPTLGLPEANPCAWDATHLQSGSNCVVGEGITSGGVAYHLATSNNPSLQFPWMPAIGSPDFCAAADHFIAAGVATTSDTGTCLLNKFPSSIIGTPTVQFYVRTDNSALMQLGQSVGEEICALLSGSFTTSCSIPSASGVHQLFTLTNTLLASFPGFNTQTTSLNLNWWMYTAGVGSQLFPSVAGGDTVRRPGLEGTDPFDTVLYFGFNSLFVSGVSSIKPPCSSNAMPGYAPSNYYYVCVSGYDTNSTQMEFAPCLSASGDPTNGQVTPTFANCPSTSQPTAVSAGYKTEDQLGKNAYTIPVWAAHSVFGYGSNWQSVINSFGGIANYYSLLNAHSSQSSTIRQGLSSSIISLNPYTATTYGDFMITGGVYDSPRAENPKLEGTTLDWMTVSTQVLTNGQLTYTPAPGTVQIYRYTFRNDIFWQTGQKLTAWDAAFSYVSLLATGSFPIAGRVITGIQVLSPTQVDVGISAFGPFTGLYLSGVPILPTRFWLRVSVSPACSASAWDNGASNPNFAAANAALKPCIGSAVTASGVVLPVATCDLNGQSPGTGTSPCSGIDTNKLLPTYDPVASGILVGSGPWVCKSSGGVIGSACSSTGTQSVAPGGTYTLQRYGLGTTPAGSLNSYFRSSGNLALWIWSGNTGGFNHDFLNFGVVSLCFGQPLLPLGTTTGCGHWQQGIGAPAGHSTVGLTQVGIVQRFVGVNWVSPFDWVNAPPKDIASFAPVLYEGISTGNAGNPFGAGVSQTLNPASVAGCTSAYPAGGYDC